MSFKHYFCLISTSSSFPILIRYTHTHTHTHSLFPSLYFMRLFRAGDLPSEWQARSCSAAGSSFPARTHPKALLAARRRDKGGSVVATRTIQRYQRPPHGSRAEWANSGPVCSQSRGDAVSEIRSHRRINRAIAALLFPASVRTSGKNTVLLVLAADFFHECFVGPDANSNSEWGLRLTWSRHRDLSLFSLSLV